MRIHLLVSVLVTVLSCLASFNVLQAASASEPVDWPNLRGPDSLSGVVPAADWLGKWNGAKTVWQAQVHVGFSSFAIANNIAVTLGNQNNQDIITALDAKSGKKLWAHQYVCAVAPKMYEGGPNATPTIDGKVVYTLSKEGHVFCLQLKTGKVVWQRQIKNDHGLPEPDWGFSSSPLVIKNFVFLNAGSHGIALDKRNGKTAWVSGKGKAGYASVAPYEHAGKAALLVFAADALHCVDAASGKSLWNQAWKTSYGVNAAVPVPFGDKQVFVASGYNYGCSLLSASGQVYKNRTMQCQQNGPVLIDGYLYGVNGHNGKPGELVCMDPKDGSKKWGQMGFGQGSVIAVGTKLLVLSDKGLLVMAEAQPESYKELGRQQILNGKTWTQPAIANGHLFARDAQGNAICLDLR